MFDDLIPYTNVHELNLDWIIKKVREYIEKTDVLEINFKDLKNYVKNYFDNLDVQEEIDNKLEDMLEHGELASLIAQFLTTESLLVFNTKALMKSGSNLVDGVSVMTIGDSVYNDGNTRLYYIRTLTSSDTVDDVNIVALTNYPTLIAELIHNNFTGSKRKIIFVGDSFMSTVHDDPEMGIMTWLPTYMKLSSGDYYDATRNGAGFMHSGSNTYLNNIQNLISVSNPYEITDIFICGGWNDRNYSDADLENAMDSFMTYVKQTYPNAVVKVAYLGWTGANSGTTRQEAINGIYKYKLCSKHGMVYVTNSQFINHLYDGFDSDFHHPNVNGAKNMAEHLASALINGCADVNYKEYAVPVEISDSDPLGVTSVTGGVNIVMSNGFTNVTCSDSYIRWQFPSQTLQSAFLQLGKFPTKVIRPFLSRATAPQIVWVYDGTNWIPKTAMVQIQGDITTGYNTIGINFGESIANISRLQIYRMNLTIDSLWS